MKLFDPTINPDTGEPNGPFTVQFGWPSAERRRQLHRIDDMKVRAMADLAASDPEVYRTRELTVEERNKAMADSPELAVRATRVAHDQMEIADTAILRIVQAAIVPTSLTSAQAELVASDVMSSFWQSQDIDEVADMADTFSRACLLGRSKNLRSQRVADLPSTNGTNPGLATDAGSPAAASGVESRTGAGS